MTGPSSGPAPGLEPWLRDILRCPACHGTLRDVGTGVRSVDGGGSGSGTQAGPDSGSGGGPALRCEDAACARTYPVRDGIPVLLVDEADGGAAAR